MLEIVQGGTGFITSKNNLQMVRQKCNNTETLQFLMKFKHVTED